MLKEEPPTELYKLLYLLYGECSVMLNTWWAHSGSSGGEDDLELQRQIILVELRLPPSVGKSPGYHFR